MASQDSKKSKKRKSVGGSSSDVTISMEDSMGVGPAFGEYRSCRVWLTAVNFPAVRPSKNTPFDIYSREDDPSSSAITKQHTLIAGETEDVEYFSTNRDRYQAGEGHDCQYVPAVYDPSTKTLHVHPTTPLYLLAHRVKRMREAPLSETQRSELWKQRRNDLGETFGTRKAKSQIKAEERNKVDANAMQGVKARLMESIGVLESKDDAHSRSRPGDQGCHEGVPARVHHSGQPVGFDRRPTAHYGRGQGACQVVASSSAKKHNLKMLYYLACLLSFYKFAGGLHKLNATELPAKFPGVPAQILNGMLTTFAEQDGKKFKVTEKSGTKLFAWICVCFLALNGWTIEVERVARELAKETPKVVDMFKSLGCNVDLPTPAEREKMGIKLADANKFRKATLKAPLKFPKTKRRGPAKR
ncbi:hypothetical protein A1Q1_03905 [Trichosporon asahii var. asahii CBS 2479]|uniref:DNA-directed RNA polymerase I subunit RPA49 n=1 Tax=Trichosporon asahii var. asahii (strain ATCC 90039 / CBS 2479 / JCM 2466 / KCTC 7840 / NBRC 103889/ NCYC 2677 / UAMH 7654) TaxID=1186058 RepID=J5SSB4_TRIAS|nr:hypothetical protein A1Q1_03905 [Trichosporon asahii var. asahii CBS 2479]EJT47276.1 hypothetical protein A1Q1_03905 [Trichosporon asahii var. asahii CBS 2479]